MVSALTNYQNYDAAGLTAAKQFLLKNAANDFSRLPKTKDGFGKGTFLPRNVMAALYTDGVLTGNLKDYINLLRQKYILEITEKFIYFNVILGLFCIVFDVYYVLFKHLCLSCISFVHIHYTF